MRSIKLPSWIERGLGLKGRRVPPHVFAVDDRELRYGRFSMAGTSLEFCEYDSVKLPIDSFQPGVLGGVLREPGAFSERLQELLDRRAIPVHEASLVIPDRWLRVFFVSVDKLPRDRSEREELFRWRLNKSVPFRIDELRLREVPSVPLAAQKQSSRWLLGLGSEALLRQLEEGFAGCGVWLGQISSAGLSALGALYPMVADAPVAAVLLVQEAGYSVILTQGGVPVLHRFKAMANGTRGTRVQSAWPEELVIRDLKLTRAYVREHLAGVELSRAVLISSRGNEDWWKQALREGFEVEAPDLRWEHFLMGSEVPEAPWEEAVPMLGAACQEIA